MVIRFIVSVIIGVVVGIVVNLIDIIVSIVSIVSIIMVAFDGGATGGVGSFVLVAIGNRIARGTRSLDGSARSGIGARVH